MSGTTMAQKVSKQGMCVLLTFWVKFQTLIGINVNLPSKKAGMIPMQLANFANLSEEGLAFVQNEDIAFSIKIYCMKDIS
jgi:hypothetical protein